jgi:hypothetical protein
VTVALSPLVRKEVRALAPLWVALMATLMLVGLIGPTQARFFFLPRLMAILSTDGLGVLVFVLGAVSLGAMSMGHEYTHHTLAQFLALPDQRRRLFRTKRVVLTLFLFALTGAAAVTILRDVWLTPQAILQSWRGALLVLVPLLALSVAPWLTMVCRNPLAGIVFTLAIPTAFWVTGDVVSSLGAEVDNDAAADGLRYTVLWIGVLATSALAALWSRHAFLRLEVRDDHGAARIEMPAFARRRVWTREASEQRGATGPLLALVRKELRLQSLTMIVAALYGVLWAALLPFAAADAVKTTLFSITVLYVGLITTLAGAIPSAEERALGTLEWQLLQPASASTQWVVKAGTAIVVSLTLAFALPMLFETVFPQVGSEVLATWQGTLPVRGPLRRLIGPATLLTLITCCGLYVSSVCAGAVRALIMTWPLAAFMVVIPGALYGVASAAAWDILGLQAYADASQRAFDLRIAAGVAAGPAGRQSAWVSPDAILWSGRLVWLAAGLFVGLTAMLLRMGFTNHRSAEHDRGRVVRQLAWLLLVSLSGALLQGAMPNVLLRAFATMP